MKNVYIIGDSISMGYTPVVAEMLKGMANVDRNPGNAQYSSYGLLNLRGWLGNLKYDVIHFNWGIWDLHRLEPAANPLEPSTNLFNPKGVRRTTPEQYIANLRAIIGILRTTGAHLIWASITPLPDVPTMAVRAGEEVLYNTAAARLMNEQGIPINDLYSYAQPKMTQLMPPEDCHFTEAGYRYLGEKVAKTIAAALP